jgi:hypothetical protein
MPRGVADLGYLSALVLLPRPARRSDPPRLPRLGPDDQRRDPVHTSGAPRTLTREKSKVGFGPANRQTAPGTRAGPDHDRQRTTIGYVRTRKARHTFVKLGGVTSLNAQTKVWC